MTTRREFVRTASVLAAGAALGCREAATEPRVLVPLPRSPGGRLTATPTAPQLSVATGLQALNIGASRDGQLFVPSTYSPSRPIPLLVLFHGAGGVSANWFGSYDDRGEAAGYAMLAIDSRSFDWDLVASGSYSYDLAFLDQALAHTFNRVAVDPKRIAVAGFSTGAAYALGIGLTNGDLFSNVISYTPVEMSGIDAHGTPRVFISHGRGDALPIDLAARPFVGQLRAAGYDVTLVEFDGGHIVPQRISDRAFEWLDETW